MIDDILYAVYPGTVTLMSGEDKTWTAIDLAAAYGVDGEDYLIVNNISDLPDDPKQIMRYIHLKPRSDDLYEDIMYVAEDDGQEVAYRPDFDARKKYIQETDPENINPDTDIDFHG